MKKRSVKNKAYKHNLPPIVKYSSHNIEIQFQGMLQDGQEIAVKRLSKGSGQGLTEFKNEVTLHRQASTSESCEASRMLHLKKRC